MITKEDLCLLCPFQNPVRPGQHHQPPVLLPELWGAHVVLCLVRGCSSSGSDPIPTPSALGKQWTWFPVCPCPVRYLRFYLEQRFVPTLNQSYPETSSLLPTPSWWLESCSSGQTCFLILLSRVSPIPLPTCPFTAFYLHLRAHVGPTSWAPLSVLSLCRLSSRLLSVGCVQAPCRILVLPI